MFVTSAATGCPPSFGCIGLPASPNFETVSAGVPIAELRVLMAPPASAARQKLGVLQQQFRAQRMTA
jgi:hypothetical protein